MDIFSTTPKYSANWRTQKMSPPWKGGDFFIFKFKVFNVELTLI